MNHIKPLLYSVLTIILIVTCTNQLKKEVAEYYENGVPKRENFYTLKGDNKEVVKEIQYFNNGQKKLVGHYKNGKKDGKWTFWYVNGQKQSEGYFFENLKTGETLVYHENGKPFYKGSYVDGKKDGKWIFYNDQGKEVNQITFSLGKIVTKSGNAKTVKVN